MRYKFIISALSIAFTAHAQEQVEQLKLLPATKLEAFSTRTGSVIIKGYSNLGFFPGKGSVSMDVREFRDGSNPKLAQYGVAFELKESGSIARESISFIDEDEIDSLIRGLDYIGKIEKNATPFNEFEAHYKTKGDLSFVVFSGKGYNEINFSVYSGRIVKTRVYLQISDIERIRSLLNEAKNQITAAKIKIK